MEILDGKLVSEKIRESVKKEVETFSRKPKLSVILVGDDAASHVYVGMKAKACKEAGIISEEIRLSANTTEEEILAQIDRLNEDKECDAILCQLPLPSHINEHSVLERINPDRDVDCFHPYNVGRLAVGRPLTKPCTPAGVIEILKHYNIEIAGKNAVIVGRSNIVGKPLFNLLLAENATVTVCHSKTKDLEGICKKADILCAAIGRAEFVKGSFIKEGAVVIDVGMNRVEDSTKERGYRLTGDVAFDEASHASYITPVPKGVGPMTIAMLLKSTLDLYKLH